MGLFDFLFNSKLNSLEKKYERLMDKAYNPSTKDDDISQLEDNEKIFYVLYTFDIEFQNGGLCQFFVNSSRTYAPLVSDYLNIVGARDHQKIFDNFVITNNIDLNDLSMFIIDDLSEYQDKVKVYPFDEFDDLFGKLPELINYIENF